MTEESTVDNIEVEAAPETPATEPATTEEVVDEFEGVTSLDAVPEETTDNEAEAETSEDDTELEGEEAEESEAEGEAPELVEFNFGGNKLEIEKGSLSPELESKVQEFSDNIWKDYTKGKQAVAEQTKSLAERETAMQTLTNLNGEALQTYSHGLQLRGEIEQLSQVDLQSLWQSEPDRARRISDALSSKQAEFSNIVALVGQQENALTEAQQGELDRRKAEGVQTLDKRIKDFSTTHAPEVVKYAVENYGMNQAEAEQWQTNPTVTEMAYKAMMYDRMQTKVKSKPKVKAASVIKPIKATGKASKPHDPNDMSFKELGKVLGI